MNELNFNTGVKTFSLNGKAEVSFNPTDPAFAERLFTTFDALDKKQESYRATVSEMKGSSKIFDFCRERDAEMRNMIDSVFGAPVSDQVFSNMSTYALADGLPVWCNLLLSIIDILDSSFAQEQKATNPRLSKYTKKYHR